MPLGVIEGQITFSEKAIHYGIRRLIHYGLKK
jgi:hypothetical protein